MGQGYLLKCKCGKTMVNLGIGYFQPQVYGEEMRAAKDGKYGEEIQKLIEEKKYVAIDSGNRFFYCDQCGHWEVDRAHDLYEPKKLKKVLKKKCGDKTVEELGEIPFEIYFDDYNLIYQYKHMCPQCNLEMEGLDDIDEKILSKIKCAKCGHQYESGDVSGIMWD